MVLPSVLLALEEVRNSPTFIGSPDLLNRTLWRSDSDGLNRLILKPTNDDEPIVEAPVEWIGEIQASHFRLLSDGGFSAEFGSPLSVQKASARIGKPVYPTYAELWRSIPDGVARIQGSRKTQGATLGNQLLIDECLRVRHVLFKRTSDSAACQAAETKTEDLHNDTASGVTSSDVSRSESEEDTTIRGSDAQDDDGLFSIHNWPCNSPDARKQLQEMIKEGCFEVQPIPAYDMDDKLIAPQDYEAQLKNAIVRIKATISHQYLRKKKTDNFYADIQEIRVLSPPIVTATSLSKRKLQEATDRAPKRPRTACGQQ